MAAAALGTAAVVGGIETYAGLKTFTEFKRWFQGLDEDPIRTVIHFLNGAGIVGVGGGAIMGILGYFLKSSSAAAGTDASQTLQSIASTFGNVQFSAASTTLQPILGNGAINDLDNFAADVDNVLQSTWKDLSGGVGAAATALSDIPKALFVSITSLPHLIWDFLVWVVGGSAGDVLNYVYPYFIIGGIICFVIAAILGYYQRYIRPTIQAKWDEWNSGLMKKKLVPALNRIFRIHNEEPVAPTPDGVAPREPRKKGAIETTRISQPASPTEPEEVYADGAWQDYDRGATA